MLVWPVSFTTLINLSWRCYCEGRFLQALPLLATQLNSTLIWASVAAFEIGAFNYNINGTSIQNDGANSLRYFMINGFLVNLVFLEPLNLFLYTWRFLKELEHLNRKPGTKKFLKWFALISILLIPPTLISIVIAFIVESVWYDYYKFHHREEKAKSYGNI
jgi:hypothetical protein